VLGDVVELGGLAGTELADTEEDDEEVPLLGTLPAPLDDVPLEAAECCAVPWEALVTRWRNGFFVWSWSRRLR
jgi:hypothetical protein